MDGRLTRTNCDEADYVVPNVLSPRDLVKRPDNMDETVQTTTEHRLTSKELLSKQTYWKQCTTATPNMKNLKLKSSN